MSTDFLWVEEYRPKTIDDCILPASLKTFFQNPQGVAEHIDYIQTVEKKVEALALAQSKWRTLTGLSDGE